MAAVIAEPEEEQLTEKEMERILTQNPGRPLCSGNGRASGRPGIDLRRDGTPLARSCDFECQTEIATGTV
jgi:hypothetical protein